MKWLKRMVLAAFGLYLAILLTFYFYQRDLLYFPPEIYLTPEAVKLSGFEEVELAGNKGAKLLAFWSPPSNDTDKVVMFFHGNGSAVYSNHDIYRDLVAMGLGVLGVGYPGYPGSEGKTSQAAVESATIKQRDFILRQGISDDRLVYFGTSLGSGVASQLAEHHPPSLLILDAPFNSIADMTRRLVPFLPINLLMRDQYRSHEALEGLQVPVIWIHGTNDSVVPLSQGQKLFDGYDGPKEAHIIDGGQHTNLWFLGGREIVLGALTPSD